MKLKDWMQYFGQSPPQRDRVLNLISLECTGTGLDTKVRPPKMLREIGWVEKHWPALGGRTAMARAERARMPKVRLYCLMSAAGSYTEFHVDFGGSSVWYHLYKGRKVRRSLVERNLCLCGD
jgi:F-box and leucine-rich repeat protein 10/11